MTDFEIIKQRYQKFWNLENETPILNLKGFKKIFQACRIL